MPPCQMLKTGNVIRVRQESHVEDQIAIRVHAVPIAEAGNVHHDLRLLALPAKLLADELAQLVDRELRGVDDQIGHRADRRQLPALGQDTPANRLILAQRVGPARLAEAPQNRLVVRLQKYKLGSDLMPDMRINIGKALQTLAFPDIHYDRRRPYASRIARELGKGRNQIHGK